MDSVEGGKCGPITGVEVVDLGLTEEVAAGVCVGFDGSASAAGVACGLGVAPLILLEKVDFDRRPDDAAVKPGLLAPSIWATTSRQSPVDDVELGWHEFFAVSNVGYAWHVHPVDRIAA